MATASTNLGRVSPVPRGEYDSQAQYQRLDIVGYGGSSYLVLRDLHGITPEDGADYMLIAKQGNTGNGIRGIERTVGTGAAGTTDTYTITMTDGSTHDFLVYNGADGKGSGDMMKSIYDTENRNTDIFKYVDERMKDVPTPDDQVTVEGGGSIDLPETLGVGPYTFEFTEEEESGEEGGQSASVNVSYSNVSSGLAAINVQEALDELASAMGDVETVLDRINGEVI